MTLYGGRVGLLDTNFTNFREFGLEGCAEKVFPEASFG
jgi:hypothetical protein